MKIDYAIISSDDSHYLDFYTTVSTMWNHYGIKTMMLHITNEDSDFYDTKFGLYKKINTNVNYPSSWQAQLVRLYAYQYVRKEKINLLTSDIDMIPLNGNYFHEEASKIDESQILNYSGQPYSDVPYYPMCYMLASSDTMASKLSLNDTFEEFLIEIKEKYTIKWNSDEHFMYDKLNKCDNLKILNRNFQGTRVDRGNWNYNFNSLKLGKYIDSHMLRPYKIYQQEIDFFVKLALQYT